MFTTHKLYLLTFLLVFLFSCADPLDREALKKEILAEMKSKDLKGDKGADGKNGKDGAKGNKGDKEIKAIKEKREIKEQV